MTDEIEPTNVKNIKIERKGRKTKMVTKVELKNLESELGVVTYKGVKYYLTDQAVADNYGTEGEVRYKSSAINNKGSKYQVVWETTDAWDRSEKYLALQNKLSDESYEESWDEIDAEMQELDHDDLVDTGDESNACDWDKPVGVYPV